MCLIIILLMFQIHQQGWCTAACRLCHFAVITSRSQTFLSVWGFQCVCITMCKCWKSTKAVSIWVCHSASQVSHFVIRLCVSPQPHWRGALFSSCCIYAQNFLKLKSTKCALWWAGELELFIRISLHSCQCISGRQCGSFQVSVKVLNNCLICDCF